jgi:hypothetical protein
VSGPEAELRASRRLTRTRLLEWRLAFQPL